MPVSLEVQGLIEAQRRAEQAIRDLRGSAMLNAVRDCVLLVQRGAKINAPVDTGRLRSSITPEVRQDAAGVIGVVGTNVFYAPYQEFGTRPHWPPVSALEVWAERHHTSAFAVARAIATRGTVARMFLQRAVEDNKARIRQRIERACAQIAGGAGE